MPLFGSKRRKFDEIANPDDLHITIKKKNDGYICVSVNGVMYGKTKAVGHMIVNEDLQTEALRAEALVILTMVQCGNMDTASLAQEIIRFRKFIRENP